MFNFINKWWNKNSWKLILISGLIVIFILWILYASNNNKSSSTNLNDAFNMIIKPPDKKNNLRSPRVEQNNLTFPRVEQNNLTFPRVEQNNLTFPRVDKKISKGENVCKIVMEELTGKPFVNVRPKWLINPITNQPLELDCYNEELQIAVEYNGKQHYEYNKFMHQNSKDKFYNQQYRDLIKKDICKKNNVILITVPYSIPDDKIKVFLMNKLRKLI
jgi:hypothetical protein